MSIAPIDPNSSAWYVPADTPTTAPADPSALLDLSPQAIEEAEKSGKSLADLAAEQGIPSTPDPAPAGRPLRNLSNVAQSTGTDVEGLLQQLRSGNGGSDDIVSILTKSNSANYGTSLSDLINGGLSVDTYA